MNKKIGLLVVLLTSNFLSVSYAKVKNIKKNIETVQIKEEIKPEQKVSEKVTIDYTLNVSVSGIPQGQQTLFIPIKLDTMILDFDRVALEGLSAQNILAVVSSSKDKVGPGIGLIKLDDSGLPSTLAIKAILKQVGEGQTAVSLAKVAEEPALPTKGLIIRKGVTVSSNIPSSLEVTEKVSGGKKRLVLNQNKVTLNINRDTQKEETIFIPLIYDKETAELDETFGHVVLGPGASYKIYNSSSLNEDGPGVELVLGQDAAKDLSIDLNLVPKRVGGFKISTAYPQESHSSIVAGPVVDIAPQLITVSQ